MTESGFEMPPDHIVFPDAVYLGFECAGDHDLSFNPAFSIVYADPLGATVAYIRNNAPSEGKETPVHDCRRPHGARASGSG